MRSAASPAWGGGAGSGEGGGCGPGLVRTCGPFSSPDPAQPNPEDAEGVGMGSRTVGRTSSVDAMTGMRTAPWTQVRCDEGQSGAGTFAVDRTVITIAESVTKAQDPLEAARDAKRTGKLTVLVAAALRSTTEACVVTDKCAMRAVGRLLASSLTSSSLADMLGILESVEGGRASVDAFCQCVLNHQPTTKVLKRVEDARTENARKTAGSSGVDEEHEEVEDEEHEEVEDGEHEEVEDGEAYEETADSEGGELCSSDVGRRPQEAMQLRKHQEREAHREEERERRAREARGREERLARQLRESEEWQARDRQEREKEQAAVTQQRKEELDQLLGGQTVTLKARELSEQMREQMTARRPDQEGLMTREGLMTQAQKLALWTDARAGQAESQVHTITKLEPRKDLLVDASANWRWRQKKFGLASIHKMLPNGGADIYNIGDDKIAEASEHCLSSFPIYPTADTIQFIQYEEGGRWLAMGFEESVRKVWLISEAVMKEEFHDWLVDCAKQSSNRWLPVSTGVFKKLQVKMTTNEAFEWFGIDHSGERVPLPVRFLIESIKSERRGAGGASDPPFEAPLEDLLMKCIERAPTTIDCTNFGAARPQHPSTSTPPHSPTSERPLPPLDAPGNRYFCVQANECVVRAVATGLDVGGDPLAAEQIMKHAERSLTLPAGENRITWVMERCVEDLDGSWQVGPLRNPTSLTKADVLAKPMPGTITLLGLLDSDGQANHCIAKVLGPDGKAWLCDMNDEHCLPLTAESLDACCVASENTTVTFQGVAKAFTLSRVARTDDVVVVESLRGLAEAVRARGIPGVEAFEHPTSQTAALMHKKGAAAAAHNLMWNKGYAREELEPGSRPISPRNAARELKLDEILVVDIAGHHLAATMVNGEPRLYPGGAPPDDEGIESITGMVYLPSELGGGATSGAIYRKADAGGCVGCKRKPPDAKFSGKQRKKGSKRKCEDCVRDEQSKRRCEH